MTGFFYNHSSYPANGAAGSASAMRAELELIEAGFDKLADPTGNANKAVVINSGATGYGVTTGTFALAGNFATVGAYASTFTMTGTTTLTFPVTGTLATLAGTEALTNKTYNGNTWTAGTGTLTLGAGKTLTLSNTLTFTGTDTSSVAFGTGGTVVYTSNKLSVHAATTSAELASVISDETGTGVLVYNTDPTFVLTDVTTNNVSATAHGWCPKFPNNTTTFLRGDGTYTAPVSGVGTNEVVVHTGNGQGSTSTHIRRFTTAMTNTGTAITYADSSTLGATFTINEAGIYSIYYADGVTDGFDSGLGISLNSAELTTSILSVTIATRLAAINIVAAETNRVRAVSRTVGLAVNDVIRPHCHTSNRPNLTSDSAIFAIRKVGLV